MGAVTVSTNADSSRVYRLCAARECCIAGINFREQQGVALTGAEVVSLIDDFCIELRCSLAEMPASLRLVYSVASDKLSDVFGKEVIIKEFNQAA